MIYFDHNSTTQMPEEVRKKMLAWCNQGNPSASYGSAIKARKMMDDFRTYIGKIVNVKTCCAESRDMTDNESKINVGREIDPTLYKVLFTSGASESNCTIVRSCIEAYEDARGVLPHVVISAIEHKSIIDLVESYVKRQRATVTYILPTPLGHILPEAVGAALNANTCLICIMHANNETGALNNIEAISQIAHAKNVPLHCDTAQTFGKCAFDGKWVDSFCISFHKMGGPPGVGCLVIKQQFLVGYNLQPCIFGTQNQHLRGGTENLPGIGASYTATQIMLTDRVRKNEHLRHLKFSTIDILSRKIPTRSYKDHLQSHKPGPFEIVYVSEETKEYLCNTLFISVLKPVGEPLCNTKIKQDLEKAGVVLSIGSSCNTASKMASHVLTAMKVDTTFKKGALRISFGDNNTIEEVKKFCDIFVAVVNKYRK